MFDTAVFAVTPTLAICTLSMMTKKKRRDHANTFVNSADFRNN